MWEQIVGKKGPESPDLAQRLEAERSDFEVREFEHGAAILRRKQKEIWPGQWLDAAGPNEDTVLAEPDLGLYGVFDGMGGHADGALASSAAKEGFVKAVQERLAALFSKAPALKMLIERELKVHPRRFAEEEDMVAALQEGVQAANDQVALATKEGGTTATVGMVQESAEGQQYLTYLNLGDSRLYRYRQGQLEQLTSDDSYVQALLEQGAIQDDEAVEEELSDQALRKFWDLREQDALAVEYPEGLNEVDPDVLAAKRYAIRDRMRKEYPPGTAIFEIRHLVRGGLSESAQVENTAIQSRDLEGGDKLLWVSDGLVDNLTRRRLGNLVKQQEDQSPSQIAQDAVRESSEVAHSQEARAKEDDMGMVVVQIEKLVPLLELFNHHRGLVEKKVQGLTYDQLAKEVQKIKQARTELGRLMADHPDNRKFLLLQKHLDFWHAILEKQQARLDHEIQEQKAALAS